MSNVQTALDFETAGTLAPVAADRPSVTPPPGIPASAEEWGELEGGHQYYVYTPESGINAGDRMVCFRGRGYSCGNPGTETGADLIRKAEWWRDFAAKRYGRAAV